MKHSYIAWLVVFSAMVLVARQAVAQETMTYEEAVERIPDRDLPPFWVGNVERLDRLNGLERGDVSTIALSPGGRPVYLVTYGDFEAVPRFANFNSAVGARRPRAYVDKSAREKPVILFVGPVHGQEVEGLTGLVNLIEIMETGRDLAGRDQPALRNLGRRCRLVIIPAGNPDGIARFRPRSLKGMVKRDVEFWGQGTWKNNELIGWPDAKAVHPMVGDTVGYLGSYFNDQGVNPMHDEFFDPLGPEAPAILNVAKREAPDLAVSLHSHQNEPFFYRPAYTTLEIQEEARRLLEAYYDLLAEHELPTRSPFEVQPDGGETPAPFNLSSAIYHVSGALSFLHECPHGLADDRMEGELSFLDILDIQLLLYEAMMRHALEAKEE